MQESLLPIDPQLETQANLVINSLGRHFTLEGVKDLGNEKMEIWYRNEETRTIVSLIVRINYNLFDSKKVVKNKNKQHKIKKSRKELKNIESKINSEFFERIK